MDKLVFVLLCERHSHKLGEVLQNMYLKKKTCIQNKNSKNSVIIKQTTHLKKEQKIWKHTASKKID